MSRRIRSYDGPSNWPYFSAGVLVGSGLMYLFCRGWDRIRKYYVTWRQQQSEGELNTSLNTSASSTTSDTTGVRRRRHQKQISPSSTTAAMDQMDDNLRNLIELIYLNRIAISKGRLIESDFIVQEVRQNIESRLKNRQPPLLPRLSDVTCREFMSQDVIKYSFHVQASLSECWQLIGGSDTVMGQKGFYFVKRTDQDFFPKGTNPWDEYTVGDYLSPSKIKKCIQKLLQSGLGINLMYTTSPSIMGNDVVFEVLYGNDEKLSVQLSPIIVLDGVTVCAEEGAESVPNGWREYEPLDVESLPDTVKKAISVLDLLVRRVSPKTSIVSFVLSNSISELDVDSGDILECTLSLAATLLEQVKATVDLDERQKRDCCTLLEIVQIKNNLKKILEEVLSPSATEI